MAQPQAWGQHTAHRRGGGATAHTGLCVRQGREILSMPVFRQCSNPWWESKRADRRGTDGGRWAVGSEQWAVDGGTSGCEPIRHETTSGSSELVT